MNLETTRHDSPFYYAPQRLHEHQLGFEWTEKWQDRVEGTLSYLPGLGKEADVSATFIQSVDVEAKLKFTERTGLRAAFGWSETPTYHQLTSELAFTGRF
jgi:hypothetical protein